MRLAVCFAAALSATACVSGGGGDAARAGVVIGGLLLTSSVARDAESGKGEKSTARLWCETLRLTKGQLGLWQGQTHTDDELTDSLAQSVYVAARDNGYALHRSQVRELILDAKRVIQDPVAHDQVLKKCPS